MAAKGAQKARVYFCPVGTVFTVFLKMVPMVDCCTRLCTKDV